MSSGLTGSEVREERLGKLAKSGEIDLNTFEQILEMDEVDDDEFSRSIVFDFFIQAEETFTNLDEALSSRDFKSLKELGHFLKGSSATLGLTKLQHSCEYIQRLGAHEDLDGNPLTDEDFIFSELDNKIERAKEEFGTAKELLTDFYDG